MSIALVEIVEHFQILGHYVVWSPWAANDEFVALVGFVTKLFIDSVSFVKPIPVHHK